MSPLPSGRCYHETAFSKFSRFCTGRIGKSKAVSNSVLFKQQKGVKEVKWTEMLYSPACLRVITSAPLFEVHVFLLHSCLCKNLAKFIL